MSRIFIDGITVKAENYLGILEECPAKDTNYTRLEEDIFVITFSKIKGNHNSFVYESDAIQNKAGALIGTPDQVSTYLDTFIGKAGGDSTGGSVDITTLAKEQKQDDNIDKLEAIRLLLEADAEVDQAEELLTEIRDLIKSDVEKIDSALDVNTVINYVGAEGVDDRIESVVTSSVTLGMQYTETITTEGNASRSRVTQIQRS